MVPGAAVRLAAAELASLCQSGYSQGLTTTSSGNRTKSCTLRVTTLISWTSAAAAMRASLNGAGSGT